MSSSLHLSYYWYFNDGSPFSCNTRNPTGPILFYSPGAPMIQLQVFDSTTGSYYTASTSITVLSLPSVTVLSTPSMPIINCIADSVILKGIGSDTTGKIVWTRPSGEIDTQKILSATTAGNYIAVSIDSSGCVSNPYWEYVSSETPMGISVGLGDAYGGIMSVISDSVSFCDNVTRSLEVWASSGTISGGVTYTWNTGAVSTMLNPVSASGTYWVTAVDGNGCKASDTVRVTINAMPSATITPSRTTVLCMGDTLILRANPGYTYSWMSYYTGVVTTADSVMITGTSEYQLTVMGTGGCSAINTYAATFNPNPGTTVALYGAVAERTGLVLDTFDACANRLNPTALGLSGWSPHYSYHWNTGDTTTGFNVTASGKYVVTVTTDMGCVGSDSMYVLMHAAPDSTIMVSSAGTLCTGMTQTVHVPLGNSYAWSTGSTADSIQLTASATVSVMVTNAIGCTSASSYTALFHPAPAPSASPGPCSAIVGVIVPGDTYQWYSSAGIIPGASGPLYPATASGYYSVKETAPTGCATTSGFVYVTCGTTGSSMATDSVHAYFSESATLACHSSWFDFTNLTTAVMPSEIHYTWTFSGGIPAFSTAMMPPSVFMGVGTHTVVLTAHDTLTGAISTFTSTVVVDSIGAIVYGYSSVLPLYSTADTVSICALDSPKIGVLINEGTPTPTYLWNTGSMAANFFATATGFYKVTVTDGYGCVSEDSIYLKMGLTPDTTTARSGRLCTGDTLHLSVPTGYGYHWSTGSTANAVAITVSGVYSVAITGTGGCVASVTYPIAFNPSPIPHIAVSPAIYSYGVLDTAHICAGSSTYISASVATGYITGYDWSTGSSFSGFPVTAGTGIYKVTVTDINGCTGSDSTFVWMHAKPDSTIVPSVLGSLCSGTDLTLRAVPGYAYAWNTGSTEDSITVTSSGTYNVRVTNVYGCVAYSEPYTASFIYLDAAYIATDAQGCELGCSISYTADSFAWYHNGLLVPSDTTQYITASGPGLYAARVYKDGCSVMSDIVTSYCTTAVEDVQAKVTVSVYPNPFAESISVEAPGDYEVILNNTLGQKVAEKTGRTTVTVSTVDLPAGMYIVSVFDMHGTKIHDAKIVKQ